MHGSPRTCTGATVTRMAFCAAVCSPATEMCPQGTGDNGSHCVHTPQVAVSLTGPYAHTVATKDTSNLLSSLLSPACHCVHQMAHFPPLPAWSLKSRLGTFSFAFKFQSRCPAGWEAGGLVFQHLSRFHSASPLLDSIVSLRSQILISISAVPHIGPPHTEGTRQFLIESVCKRKSSLFTYLAHKFLSA